MAFSTDEAAVIQRKMATYIEKIRPNVEIRAKLDIAFRVDGQSVYVYEIRPDLNGRILTSDIAKTTYVRTENVWKIYWMRADLKWHAYETTNLKTLVGFIKTVEADKYGCFWG